MSERAQKYCSVATVLLDKDNDEYRKKLDREMDGTEAS